MELLKRTEEYRVETEQEAEILFEIRKMPQMKKDMN